MSRKIIVGLMGIVIVALTVSNFSARKELADTRAALEQLEAECAKLSRDSEDLSAPDESVETVAGTAPSAEVPVEEQPPGEIEDPETSGRRMMRSMSKMLDNPAMNKMMAASQRGALDVMYADLVDQFQLTGEEKEQFMELLLARQMNMVDLSMKMMAGNLTEEEQAALSADLKEKNDLMKKELEYFLNSADDVAEWEFYEKTMGDRMMLSQVEQSLGESDAALSDQTYRQLLEAMHEEKTGFDFSSNLNDDENLDMSPERFSPENIKSYAADLKALNEKTADRARSILTPEQFAAFMEALTASTEMQIAQLEMAGQMFGSK